MTVPNALDIIQKLLERKRIYVAADDSFVPGAHPHIAVVHVPHASMNRRADVIDSCDAVYVHEATRTSAWEAGYAYAKGKKLYCLAPGGHTAFAEALCAQAVAGLVQACDIECPAPIPGDSPIEKAFAKAWHDMMGEYPASQVQIGPHRVDFVIVKKVVVECDGHDYHSTKEQKAADAKRDRALLRAGYRVVRFTGAELHADAAACAKQALEIANC